MVNKILTLARGELGVCERPAGSNNVKYNTAYYGGPVQGKSLAWCAVFIWWLFREAGIPELYYGGGQTAYCPTLLSYHKARGQLVRGDYHPGDIVFFNFSGGQTAQHVGLCESWNGREITTIDGNTGSGNEANGGAVMRRVRSKKYIVAAIRPAYEEVETTMTKDQIREIAKEAAQEALQAWLQQQAEAKPYLDWQKNAVRKAKEQGISDGSRPLSPCLRVEVMEMISNAPKE